MASIHFEDSKFHALGIRFHTGSDWDLGVHEIESRKYRHSRPVPPPEGGTTNKGKRSCSLVSSALASLEP